MKNPFVMHKGKKASLTLAGTAQCAYTLCLDNGGISGAGYLKPFTLQLRGPFYVTVRAGFSSFPALCTALAAHTRPHQRF